MRPVSELERGIVEHYIDADLYDYEYRRRRKDVTFYAGLARDLGADRVLELACGSGRITRGLLKAGCHVTGLDLSMPMLERAQKRTAKLGKACRERSQFIRGDMTQFSLDARFPLIVMGFNSFEHLYTRLQVEAALGCVRAHLAPGGRFAFDCQNPDLKWLTRDPEKRWARTRFRHPETGVPLVYSTNHTYDPVSQIALINIYYEAEDGLSRQVVLSQRKFFPAELEALVSHAGLRIEARLSDFSDMPLSGDAESQVLICR